MRKVFTSTAPAGSWKWPSSPSTWMRPPSGRETNRSLPAPSDQSGALTVYGMRPVTGAEGASGSAAGLAVPQGSQVAGVVGAQHPGELVGGLGHGGDAEGVGPDHAVAVAVRGDADASAGFAEAGQGAHQGGGLLEAATGQA